jgi:anti-sigma B factor antagonist
MPKADRGDVAAQIEADPELRRTPILFLTALVTKAEAKAGLHIQGRPVLAKPINIPDLIKTIERLRMKKFASPGVATHRKDHSNILPLAGEIDLHVSPIIRTSLNEMIAKKPKQLVVDLSGVPYIDSAGLAAVMEAMQEVQAYGGKFALAGLQKTVRSVFEMSQLHQVFSIYPDVDAALAAA